MINAAVEGQEDEFNEQYTYNVLSAINNCITRENSILLVDCFINTATIHLIRNAARYQAIGSFLHRRVFLS